MTFNPNRLGVARKRRLLTKSALADRIGVEPHTISRWEGRRTEPTRENLSALVVTLGFPGNFFFGPSLAEPDPNLTSFRSQTSMTAAVRDAALAAGTIGFLVSDWVDTRFELPKADIPDLRHFRPEDAARTLRQEWGLGEKPISNVVHLMESRGIKVFSLAENTARVDAYSLWKADVPYVFLNSLKSPERSRFDAAHEIAHLVLHQDGSVTGREAEDQADSFASALLMPKADVLAALPRVQHLGQLIRAKARWKVSLAALNYRLHKIGVTTEWKNRDFCIEIARKGYHKAEPNGIERERSVVWDKVLKSLWAERTTPNDMANELCLPVSEISDLLFGLRLSRSSHPSPDAFTSRYAVVSEFEKPGPYHQLAGLEKVPAASVSVAGN